MRIFKNCILIAVISLILISPSQAETVPHETINENRIGIDEKLGHTIPLTDTFYDATGQQVQLKDIITIPTIIAPVYYTCPSVCNLLQSKLAQVLPRVTLKPGVDYQVISFSFDDKDTPEIAAQKKRNYSQALNGKYPPEYWHFLTGNKQSIRSVLNAAGYYFKKAGKEFAHPTALFVVNQEGKIIRYIYGSNFLPFDLTMAASEAEEGKTGWSVKRVLSICFSYDPAGKKYVFNIMRVSGAVVVFFAFSLFIVLLLFGKKRK